MMITQKKSEIIVPKIEYLDSLLVELLKMSSLGEKLKKLEKLPIVSEYFELNIPLKKYFEKASIGVKFAILSVLAIGEGSIVFRGYNEEKNIDNLIHVLTELEHFYDTIGGIIGYHLTVLRLITGVNVLNIGRNTHFVKPEGIDLSRDTQEVRDAVRWGIEHFPEMGEIYPVGGAGDRLNLQDAETGLPLPAAQLMFGGRTLLEGLIRDLQARELLYYKFFGKRVITPIALMTSEDKDNDNLVKTILKKNNWFGRPKESLKIFCQPLVPVVTIDGHWSMSDVLTPTLKPGGHGVMWKIAEDSGVFEWFAAQKRTKSLVRQINNPIAGVDQGLVAFVGIGLKHDKAFGFASCFRLLNAAEGVVVLVERKIDGEFHYTISNIEYTNFGQYGIHDTSSEPGSPYSLYPANTNILFVDLEEIRKVIKQCPIPGMLINLKSTAPYIDADGKHHKVKAGRLETTMQNVSDHIYESFSHKIEEDHFDRLRTFLTFNERRKTISVTKNSYEQDKSILETPEGCFYDILLNAYDLLMNFCNYSLPHVGNQEDYLNNGPGFIFIYHPALGPLYSIISQKIISGKLSKGSELQLEIAEVYIKDLHLDGSFIVCAENLKGRCLLENVTVNNLGINRKAANVYWKNEISRDEELRITIHGSGEFVAKNITFTGPHLIEVPDGCRVTAFMDKGSVHYHSEKITESTWEWNYTFDPKNNIILNLVY